MPIRNEFVQQLVALGQELTEERNQAQQLWSWLPSHKIAEKHHGDYAAEFCPSPQNVMTEAAMYISYLNNCADSTRHRPYTLDEQNWFMSCPCDNDHNDGSVE